MGICFERGAFENPDDPGHHDDVDSAIVVVTDVDDRDAVRRAIERCILRWQGIDGAGCHHDGDDAAFWSAQSGQDGPEWHTAKHFSQPTLTEVGIEIEVDVQGLMPAPMREAYRRILEEELDAVAVRDAVVRSQYTSSYETVGLPAGPWPPYSDSPLPGLPPGVLPGRLVQQDLRRHRSFSSLLLDRNFDDAWEASATAVVDCGEDEAVRRTSSVLREAGWVVNEPQELADWDGKPMTMATMARSGAVGAISCQAADDARGRGLRIPRDAPRVALVIAYYDVEPP